MSINHWLLTNFLVEAKRSTYASQGDDASVQPLLNGSKQLEYRSGDYFYRDIYFGSAFFIGQETVEFENHPIWSMVYSGGVIIPNASWDIIAPIYGFLRQALGWSIQTLYIVVQTTMKRIITFLKMSMKALWRTFMAKKLFYWTVKKFMN